MNAIDQKDLLLELVHQAGTVDEQCQRWHRVLSALELTLGLWSELGYAYKGHEICEIIIAMVNLEMRIEADVNRHHATARKIERLLEEVRGEAIRISSLFYNEQQARFAEQQARVGTP